MVRLGVSCAELAVRGADYRQPLADGMLRILDVDAGIGVVQLHLDEEISADSLVTVAGTPQLTAESARGVLPVIAEHPLLSRRDFPVCGASRVSDLTCLPAFWEEPAWQFVHGINEGRYPAMLSLTCDSDRVVFIGAQRRRSDFTDDDMEVFDAIRQPLTSALAFRSALDRATRRLERLRVVDNPEHDEGWAATAEAAGTDPGTVADRLASIHLLPDPCATATAAPLTPREREVLALVAAGWTNLRVGRLLGITERTVRKHLGNVYDKLAVSGRTSAATWWVSQNLG